MPAAESLSAVASAIASGGIEVVDLTAPLGPDTPVLRLPPEFGRNTPPFRMNEISAYDGNGPWWAWGWMELGEHTGTHFDAPAHWISGRDRPDNTTDKLPAKDFVAPVCVIDCSKEVAADPDFVLTAEGVGRWEAEHGAIPEGAWVFMRSDWHPRNSSAESFLNGGRTPGPSVDCVRALVARNVLGWGSECVGTDAGMAHAFDPPFPAHHLLLERGRYGLASLVNLDRLPPTGALVVATPLKIVGGTGSPVRVVALVPRD